MKPDKWTMATFWFILLAALLRDAGAMTFTPHGGSLPPWIICDDVTFTYYRKPEGGIVHGRQVPQGAFVLTCPRTNATWDLVITGCGAPKVVSTGPGAYSLSC